MKNWILAIVLILVFALPTFAANPRRQARQEARQHHVQPVRNFVQAQAQRQLPFMPVRNFLLNHANMNTGGSSCPGGVCR